MSRDFTIIVFISGRGSNLGSLIRNQANYRIIEIISDQAEAPGLALGAEFDIPTKVFPATGFSTSKARYAAMKEHCASRSPSLICLAGFMRIIPADFIEAFNGRLVNIHPSLLPLHPGLNTHERALAAGDSEHGCTVHFVDTGVDTGARISQAGCAVETSDTPDSLAGKVLALEHKLYPWTVNQIAAGNIALSGGKVIYSDDARFSAASLGFKLF